MAMTAEQNERRALTLLRLIDDDARAAVLESLPEGIKGELKNRIRFSTREKLPSSKSLGRLLEEFQSLFECVQSMSGPRLKLHQPEDDDELEENEMYELTGKVKKDLERMNLYQLAGALAEEHPRTAALILSSLSTNRVALLMQELPTTQRLAVAKEMARNPQAPAVVFEKIASSTIQRATTHSPREQKEVNAVLRMADVFREINKSDRSELIESIREDSPQIALELQKAMYRFDDLLELEDRTVQAVLAQVDSSTLQEALFEADEAIIEKIMSNLSRRAAATLRDELAYQRSVPGAQLKLARESIAQVIGEVDEEAA